MRARASHPGVLLLLLVACWGLATSTRASIVVFRHEGIGTGTLGGVPFAQAAFVIRAEADTANRQVSGPVYWIEHSFVTISISGRGTFRILSATRTFVNRSIPVVGFSRGGTFGNDLFDGPTDHELADWDMLGGIGPLSGPGKLLDWNPPLSTTGGTLYFEPADSPVTFTAVPAPSVLLVLAAPAFLPRRRR